jgi:hypothetical protein
MVVNKKVIIGPFCFHLTFDDNTGKKNNIAYAYESVSFDNYTTDLLLSDLSYLRSVLRMMSMQKIKNPVRIKKVLITPRKVQGGPGASIQLYLINDNLTKATEYNTASLDAFTSDLNRLILLLPLPMEEDVAKKNETLFVAR